MSRWFRVYDDLVDDPKIQRLPGDTVKSLLNLWCLASQNNGLLPAEDDIAFKLRTTPAKVKHLLSVLGECGLMDSDETGIKPHNWNGRQFKSDVSNERVKQHRERKRNVTQTVTETPPETEQKQTTEQKDAASAASASEEKQLFDVGKELLGPNCGGVIKKLLAAKDGVIPLARAALETSRTKSNPREYIGAIIRSRDGPSDNGRSF